MLGKAPLLLYCLRTTEESFFPLDEIPTTVFLHARTVILGGRFSSGNAHTPTLAFIVAPFWHPKRTQVLPHWLKSLTTSFIRGCIFLGVHGVWSILGSIFNRRSNYSTHSQNAPRNWPLTKIHPHISTSDVVLHPFLLQGNLLKSPLVTEDRSQTSVLLGRGSVKATCTYPLLFFLFFILLAFSLLFAKRAIL